MEICVATVVTCWLCLLIVTPRKPRWGNEVEELVYTRLLGRQHLLFGINVAITAAMALVLVITLPQRMMPDIDVTLSAPLPVAAPDAAQPPLLSAYCDATAAHSPVCYFPQPEHQVELKAERQADRSWQVVATHWLPRAVDDGQ